MHTHEQITGATVDAAYKLHTKLGPGLMESVYEILLARMLEERGFKVERQKSIAIEFDGIRLPDAFRVDLLVEGRVVVELKALESLAPVHVRQTVTYLRLLDQPVGLLSTLARRSSRMGCGESPIPEHRVTTLSSQTPSRKASTFLCQRSHCERRASEGKGVRGRTTTSQFSP